MERPGHSTSVKCDYLSHASLDQNPLSSIALQPMSIELTSARIRVKAGLC